MGWLYMTRSRMGGHLTAKSYLDAQLTYEREIEGKTEGLCVLASSCLRNQVYYAAVKPYGGADTAAFAVVCLVRWNPRDKEGLIFGYKDMTENAGPCEAECPARILALLDPTDSENAIGWRRRCLATISRRGRRLIDGDRIRMASEIAFTDGHAARDFIIHRHQRQTYVRSIDNGQLYRVRWLMDRAWDIVVEPKIHRTVFPPRA